MPNLVKGELPLEVDEQPAVAEEVVEAGLVLHEGMHWGVQQLHQIPQRQELGMHCPTGRRECQDCASGAWGSNDGKLHLLCHNTMSRSE